MLNEKLVTGIKEQVRQELASDLGSIDVSNDTDEMKELIKKIVCEITNDLPEVNNEDRKILIQVITNNFIGFGPLEPLIKDDTISEIMVDGGGYDEKGKSLPPKVSIEKNGLIQDCPTIKFDDEKHLMLIIDRIAERSNRRVDTSSPILDTRLVDGSRVNAVIPPSSIDGPSLNIRKYRKDMMTVRNLVDNGTMTEKMMRFIATCVACRCPVIFSGGTGSGKTTLLNAFSQWIPDTERIITIEDPCELQLNHNRIVRLETRPAGIEGTGQITMDMLLTASLRKRPDRIIVGECRSSETYQMIRAMSTGHDGSLTTVHANDPIGALGRIESMILSARPNMSQTAVRNEVALALTGGLIVQTERMTGGARKCTHITAVTGFSEGVIGHQDLFLYKNGKFSPQGFQPTAIKENILRARGHYDATWFVEGA